MFATSGRASRSFRFNAVQARGGLPTDSSDQGGVPRLTQHPNMLAAARNFESLDMFPHVRRAAFNGNLRDLTFSRRPIVFRERLKRRD
jgi:hypothetical protein